MFVLSKTNIVHIRTLFNIQLHLLKINIVQRSIILKNRKRFQESWIVGLSSSWRDAINFSSGKLIGLCRIREEKKLFLHQWSVGDWFFPKLFCTLKETRFGRFGIRKCADRFSCGHTVATYTRQAVFGSEEENMIKVLKLDVEKDELNPTHLFICPKYCEK